MKKEYSAYSRQVDKISVVIASSQAMYLERCIESVLRQTYPYIDLCVYGNHCCLFDEEKIVDFIEKKRGNNLISLEVEQFQFVEPQAVFLNHSLERVESKFVVFLCGDDYFSKENTLEDSIRHMESNRASVLFGISQIHTGNKTMTLPVEESIEYFEKYCSNKDLLLMMAKSARNTLMLPQAAVWDADTIRALGGFDTTYPMTPFYPLILKILKYDIPFCWYHEQMTTIDVTCDYIDQPEVGEKVYNLYDKELIRIEEELISKLLADEVLTLRDKIEIKYRKLKHQAISIYHNQWQYENIWNRLLILFQLIPCLVCGMLANSFSPNFYGRPTIKKEAMVIAISFFCFWLNVELPFGFPSKEIYAGLTFLALIVILKKMVVFVIQKVLNNLCI